MDDRQTLTENEIAGAGLDGWTFSDGALHARVTTGSFAAGLAIVNRIAEAADEANHHPDLDLRFPVLDVHLSSHDVGGVTARDLRLATRVSEFVAEAGLSFDPAATMWD